MNAETLLTRIVQVGTVTAVMGTKARVLFRDSGMTSDWLSVLQTPGAGVGMREAGDPSHVHAASVTTWVPAVNDTVVCLYLPIANSDGFILGKVV